jgi:hypothetical protein
MTSSPNREPSQQEFDAQAKKWTQAEYARARTHVANLGWQNVDVMQSESRVLPPLVALWRLHGKLDGKIQEGWVITGQDVPIDHIPLSAAGDARAAMKHFFMTYQLKAARLEQGLAAGKPEVGSQELQQQYIASLIRTADRLNTLVNTESLWPQA